MTEREILDKQEQTGNREFFLVLVGSFLHAYGNGAFALARLTGYRVMRKRRKWGEVLTTGFPVSRLDQVRQRMRDADCDVEELDGKTYLFRGADGTPDETMVSEPAPRASAAVVTIAAETSRYAWLAEAVRGFNLSLSTPLGAMLLIGTLQQRLKEEDNSNTACESPAG